MVLIKCKQTKYYRYGWNAKKLEWHIHWTILFDLDIFQAECQWVIIILPGPGNIQKILQQVVFRRVKEGEVEQQKPEKNIILGQTVK